MTRTYTIATLRNGELAALDLPLMSMPQAQRHLDKLKALAPSAPLYIINAHSA
jgi:FtsZ-interacting cell division protein YlmF